jgi:hypothetical protein
MQAGEGPAQPTSRQGVDSTAGRSNTLLHATPAANRREANAFFFFSAFAETALLLVLPNIHYHEETT